MTTRHSADATDSRGPRRNRNVRSHRAILDATNQLLAEVGYAGLTIEGVAGRAGVGKATVYRWWPSKGALAIEAMRATESSAPVEETGDLRADLTGAVRAVIATLTGSIEGAVIPSMTADLVRDPVLAELFRDQILRRRRSALASMLSRAIARGDVRPDVDVQLMLDACVGALFYRLVVRGQSMTDAVADELVRLLLDGAAAEPGQVGAID